MLFNSYTFLFAFLPIVLIGFHLLKLAARHQAAIAWLVVASLFFYAWWNPIYLVLLGLSIVFNFGLGGLLQPGDGRPSAGRKALLAFGISANLGAIAYFKYANFFVSNVNGAFDVDLPIGDIVLPLAISFFTFQQIAYLIDSYRGETSDHGFLHYCVFVTFFPQLIAGPIVHHSEVLPQFSSSRARGLQASDVSIGCTILAIGLFKKVVLADGVAAYASPVFNAASSGATLTVLEAWGGALAYTCQLYFDFSGYSDMAVGLGRMFGVRLPINFDSPYKAVNIIDFWRRWHITLSRFLRDYVYFALGGNRYGGARRYTNLLITMLLGGLWHGAGWTFVLWGALHGAYLCVNHAWHALRRRLSIAEGAMGPIGSVLARATTFLAVVVGWVLFRAENIDAAKSILASMAGLNGIQLPSGLQAPLAVIGGPLEWMGVTFGAAFRSGVFDPVVGGAWLVVLLSVAFLWPNTQQLVGEVASRAVDVSRLGRRVPPWSVTPRWALIVAFVFVLAVSRMTQVSEFLYFQF